MNRFWDKIIEPLLYWAKPKKIVEIGSLYGHNTMNILPYCFENGSKLLTIDPAPAFDIESLKIKYRGYFCCLQDYSLCILPELYNYDFVLIDGDHNWFTVYHELKTIEIMAKRIGKYPIVICHDTEWPYGRRDMYYFPDTIPGEYRKPYDTKGVVLGNKGLVDGGANQGLYHAIYENGERNGVLTAIEDFISETSFRINLHKVASNHGLGILVPSEMDKDNFINNLIQSSGL